MAYRVRGQVGASKVVFGVLSEGLVGRPGGVFLGLIKEREKDIRPSFLGFLLLILIFVLLFITGVGL